MKIADRLSATYDISGVLVHKYQQSDFGTNYFGTLEHMTKGRTTGYELVESIRIAEEHVADVQRAIRNMLCILETAEPIKEEPKA